MPKNIKKTDMGKECKFNIPTDKEDKRRLLIDLEENVGVILREEKGFFIVSKYSPHPEPTTEENHFVDANNMVEWEKEFNEKFPKLRADFYLHNFIRSLLEKERAYIGKQKREWYTKGWSAGYAEGEKFANKIDNAMPALAKMQKTADELLSSLEEGKKEVTPTK